MNNIHIVNNLNNSPLIILPFPISRLLQNVGPRVKAIPESELITAMTRPTRTGAEEPQQENGTSEGATSSPSKANNGNTNNNSSGNHQHDTNQDVDIDVVQDNNEGASTSTSNHEATTEVSANNNSTTNATAEEVI